MVPLDSVAIVGREFVVEIMVAFAEGYERCNNVIAW